MIDGTNEKTSSEENYGLSHKARMAVSNEGFSLGLDDIQTAKLFQNQQDMI